MTTIEPDDLREAAEQLRSLYRELDWMKHKATHANTESITRPPKGPELPMRTGPLSKDEALCFRLHDVVGTAAQIVDPGRSFTRAGVELCRWLSFHSWDVADLPFADWVMNEVREQIRELSAYVSPQLPAESIPAEATVWGSAADIAHQASWVLGSQLDRKQITYWGRSGRVEIRTAPDGAPLYSLTDVIKAHKIYTDRRKR